LKKRSKKLLRRCRGPAISVRQEAKVFWFFFSKKNILSFSEGDADERHTPDRRLSATSTPTTIPEEAFYMENAVPATQGRYKNFAAFYPFYITEHANRTSRRLHVIGTGIALCLVICGVLVNRRLLFAAPIAGYGFAWIGHAFFERNRPATFTYPLWSFFGDFRLFYEVISLRRPF
jgi:hypothetical protein